MSTANLDNQLCFALYSASNRLTSIYRPLLDPLDLTYTQFIVLMALWEEDDITISKLAKRVGLSKATMTPLLKNLESKGLVNRVIPVENERQKNIILTDRGRQTSEKSEEITERAFCSTNLTKIQAAEIIKLCNTIVKDDGS